MDEGLMEEYLLKDQTPEYYVIYIFLLIDFLTFN
jgi:hypothetical protein